MLLYTSLSLRLLLEKKEELGNVQISSTVSGEVSLADGRRGKKAEHGKKEERREEEDSQNRAKRRK